MYVAVAGNASRQVPVASKIPEGPVLGSVLFLIYVNYVVSSIACNYKLFADVIKLYLSIDVSDIGSCNYYCS